jgi:hypothetical protein
VWFEVLSLILAAVYLMDAAIALARHERKWAWVRRHYAEESMSPTLVPLVVLALVVIAVAWYATLFHYVAYGWIVTSFLTLGLLKVLAMLCCWEKTSGRILRMVDSARRGLWLLDALSLIVGVGFLLLAILVY